MLARRDRYRVAFAPGRCLEFSAREKGIEFMVNRHMDEIIREQPFSGRVLGITASYTPRQNRETGERLESFWQNGNIDERAESIHIRARKAVIIGTGGMIGNKQPTMMDPRWSEDLSNTGTPLSGRSTMMGAESSPAWKSARTSPA